jgi:osmotically-inducible protein OsmY
MIRWKTFVTAAAVGILATAGWSSRAQDPQKSTTEKIKEKVEGAVDSIKKGAVSAEEYAKEKWAQAREGVTKLGMESRVYARLHWDKSLNGSKIELGSPRAGVVSLSGSVADAKAKAKAVELTRDTVGVTDVVDNLTVQTTASTGARP